MKNNSKSEYDVHPNMALLAVWGEQKSWYEYLRSTTVTDETSMEVMKLITQVLHDMFETAKAIKQRG